MIFRGFGLTVLRVVVGENTNNGGDGGGINS